MKKKLFSLLLIGITFLGVRQVSADTLSIPHYYDSLPESLDYLTNYSSNIDDLVSYWENNFRSISSNYIITSWEFLQVGGGVHEGFCLLPLTTNNVIFGYALSDNDNSLYSYNFRYSQAYNLSTGKFIQYCYDIDSNTYIDLQESTSTGLRIYNAVPMISSQPLVLSSITNSNNNTSVDSITISSYISNDISIPSYSISVNDYLPVLKDIIDDNYNPNPEANYTTINLQDYEYVILSLKNYDQDSFKTIFYVQGQLCLTPVYDYGMKEKKFYYNDYQVQGCSANYITFTSVPIYILQADLYNHAVYYINNPDNLVDNIIKVDSNVFNISYITQSNVNNPTVVINGRQYPTIPYDQLTDTAIISTNEGYVSGQSCALGDINCQYGESGMDISDLFTHPLALLQSLWGSIVSVFVLITTFISLLPLPLQTFLYTAFMLAIILGILKIIL